MPKREFFQKRVQKLGMSPKDFAIRAQVARASVYKFLQGKDIRLSTWEKSETVLHEQAELQETDQVPT